MFGSVMVPTKDFSSFFLVSGWLEIDYFPFLSQPCYTAPSFGCLRARDAVAFFGKANLFLLFFWEGTSAPFYYYSLFFLHRSASGRRGYPSEKIAEDYRVPYDSVTGVVSLRDVKDVNVAL